jgi:hypothetical protein
MRHAIIALAALASCTDAGPPPRTVELDTTVAGGLSPELSFEVPAGSRSVTIVATGAPTGLYALGELVFADGVDLVGVIGDPGPAMQASYNIEQVGQMPGTLFQSIRLGTFTHVYPYAPGQQVPVGRVRFRVASDTAGPVHVSILVPEDDGGTMLPIHVEIVSSTLADPTTPAFVAELQRVFAQAGITAQIAGVERLEGTGLDRITQSTEPQEAPDSQTAQLPGLVTDTMRDGIDVFFVDALPFGIGGLSLGTPGPPIRRSYYFGIAVRGGLGDAEAADVVAHEVSHFLALQHVENVGASGMVYPDPIDDTQPRSGNLMEGGSVLTSGQAYALTRSPLLTP